MANGTSEVSAGAAPTATDVASVHVSENHVPENVERFGQGGQRLACQLVQQELQQHPTAWSAINVEDLMPPAFALLPMLSASRLTSTLWSVRLDNAEFALPADFPGREISFRCGSGNQARWFTCPVSSSPADHRFLDVVMNDQQYNTFLEALQNGPLGIKLAVVQGPVGPFYFNPERDEGPLVLLAAGCGLAHAMSIVRFLHDTGNRTQWQLIHCVVPEDERDARGIADELQSRGGGQARTVVTSNLLERRTARSWRAGKEYLSVLERFGIDVSSQFFVSGPQDFIDIMDWTLQMTSVPHVCIRSRVL